MNESETDGKTVEIWILEDHIADNYLVKVFAAKMERPHAHGVWVICDHQWHEKSNNPKWKGFQKIFRMKYKPTKFKHQHKIVINSSNETDSDPDNWGHVQSVLNMVCEEEVFVAHRRRGKNRGGVSRRSGF